jgi:hypothetical protein
VLALEFGEILVDKETMEMLAPLVFHPSMGW